MQTDARDVFASKKWLWAGRVVSLFPALVLLASGVYALTGSATVTEGVARLGYPAHLSFVIGLLELACTVLYLIPRTSVLGAILLTGYLGGATASHVRVGDPIFVPVIFGVLLWAGLYLRDARLRELLSLRN